MGFDLCFAFYKTFDCGSDFGCWFFHYKFLLRWISEIYVCRFHKLCPSWHPGTNARNASECKIKKNVFLNRRCRAKKKTHPVEGIFVRHLLPSSAAFHRFTLATNIMRSPDLTVVLRRKCRGYRFPGDPPKKNCGRILSMKYWLFNRDPYNSLLYSPYIWVV